jgi:hypothetical protein
VDEVDIVSPFVPRESTSPNGHIWKIRNSGRIRYPESLRWLAEGSKNPCIEPAGTVRYLYKFIGGMNADRKKRTGNKKGAKKK